MTSSTSSSSSKVKAVLKIDVEGSGCEVVEGARRVLRDVFDVQFIVMEWAHFEKVGCTEDRVEELWTFLSKELALMPVSKETPFQASKFVNLTNSDAKS